MVSWKSFAESVPFLAKIGRNRFETGGLVLLGTIRADGSPRISPLEFVFVEDHLMVGMMWKSMKALDLLRDPRFVVHSLVTNKDGTEGDFKLYGEAVTATDEALLTEMWKQVFEATGWNTTGPAHVFTLDIESCGFTQFGASAADIYERAVAAGLKPKALGENPEKPEGYAISWRLTPEPLSIAMERGVAGHRS